MALVLDPCYYYRDGGDPVSTGQISDGFHTFDELYDHRSVLFVALMQRMNKQAWVARWHDDGTMFDGFFIAGINLPQGQVTYHLKREPWFALLQDCKEPIKYTDYAPPFDGHSPADVIDRLSRWVREG